MKIDSPRSALAPRTAERPQQPAAATGNTGIVSTTALSKPQSVSTYSLPANLEPYRPVFDKVGSKIAKLPTPELQKAAIDRSTEKLSKKLRDVATPDQLNRALSEATAFYSRSTATNDPQCAMRVDRVLDFTRNLTSLKGPLKDIGLQLARNPSVRTPGQILQLAKPLLNQLPLVGREKAIAQQYLLGLVGEYRARNPGATRVPPSRDTFQILPYQPRRF